MSGENEEHSGGQGRPAGEVTGTKGASDALALRLSELARNLHHEGNTHDTLARIVRAAVELIPGVEHGSISVVTDRRQVDSQVPSGDLPRRVDRLQSETGQGPCLDAVFEQQTVRINDLSRAERWPEFAPRAVEAGARAMLSFQLYVDGDSLGALNLYSSVPDAFDDESEHVGLLFASHAAIAFADVQKREHLLRAMETRDLIGQAKGILMERLKVSGDQAFLILAQVSQDTNRKLRDVAEQLVHSGEWADN